MKKFIKPIYLFCIWFLIVIVIHLVKPDNATEPDKNIKLYEAGALVFLSASWLIFDKLPLKISLSLYSVLIFGFIGYFFIAGNDEQKKGLEYNLSKPIPAVEVTQCEVGSSGHDKCGVQCGCTAGSVWMCQGKPCSAIIPNK